MDSKLYGTQDGEMTYLQTLLPKAEVSGDEEDDIADHATAFRVEEEPALTGVVQWRAVEPQPNSHTHRRPPTQHV